MEQELVVSLRLAPQGLHHNTVVVQRVEIVAIHRNVQCAVNALIATRFSNSQDVTYVDIVIIVQDITRNGSLSVFHHSAGIGGHQRSIVSTNDADADHTGGGCAFAIAYDIGKAVTQYLSGGQTLEVVANVVGDYSIFK
ncbi:hypothetical protein D3C85_1443520 [compost metagenome]